VKDISAVLDEDSLVIDAVLGGDLTACRFAVPLWDPPKEVAEWIDSHRRQAERCGCFFRQRCLLIWLDLSEAQEKVRKVIKPD
jgi:hypothetical protein